MMDMPTSIQATPLAGIQCRLEPIGNVQLLLLSTSEARRQLSTLVEITPLPLFYSELLHTY